ncbi:MAG: TonB family protein [Bacteroidota bacterium]
MSKMTNQVSGLERHRRTYFKIGLLLSMTLCLMAFNWQVQKQPELPIWDDPIYMVDFEPEIIRTSHPKPKPPEVLSPSIVFEPDPDPIPTEPEPDPIPDPEPLVVPIKAKIIKKTPIKVEPVILPDDDDDEDPGDTIFDVVQQMPRFKVPGCEGISDETERKVCAEKAMLSYLYKNIKYPNIARQNNIEGYVVIQFIVSRDGQIVDAEIVRDIGGGCGQAALKVVEGMPNWVPGKQRLRNVNVRFNLPVKFELQ